MARKGRKLIWLLLILLAILVGAGGWALVHLNKGQETAAAPAATGSKQTTSIACLGHIEPEDGVMTLGARSLSGQPSIVAELRVKDGDLVKSGQILAVLNSKEQLESVLRQAEARVNVARNRLAQVKVGAKPSDVAAQQAEIGRLEAELANAQMEYRRYQQLRQKEVVPASALDPRRLLVETITQSLNQAKQRMTSLTEVRQVDVDLAAAELEAALADVNRARAELNQATIHSPVTGQVIRILAWPGEEVGPGGILELAKTDQMYVIAEVAEVDISRVQVGQSALVSSSALPTKIKGTVERIGTKIGKNAVLFTDPVSFNDTRVVEVKIRLEESKIAAGLIHAQVSVVINP
jgi:HlyD family secretion protein